MSDILGPANAPYSVTECPADTRTFGVYDTFFKDCTSPEVEDGTDLQAGFLNGAIKALRNVWRINGKKIDNTTPVVAENGSDDFGLAKALQHLVQRGLVLYGVDTGVANALVVTLSPALIEYKAGLKLRVKIAASNSGPATINVNGRGVVPVVRRDGSPLIDSDLVAGAVMDLVYDGTNFQVPSAFGVPALVRNLTFYVNYATGSDSNPGSAAAPVKEIQRALSMAYAFGPGPHTVTINVADSPSYGPIQTEARAGPDVVIIGNLISPQNVVINGGANHCVYALGPNTLTVRGVKVQNTAGPSNGGFIATSGARISTDTTISGSITGGVFEAYGSGGTIDCGSHVFSGNSGQWFWGQAGGSVLVRPSAIFNASTPLAVTEVALANISGNVTFPTPYPVFVNAGNVSGRKFQVRLCGAIETLGAGDSYLPGSLAGVRLVGGEYA